MLDLKSKLVLKILARECPNGAYKIVESRDIIYSMPMKYRVDIEGLENILIYLERQEYISIKYDDDGVYCVCVLPYGNEILETDSKKSERKSISHLLPIWLMMFMASLAASLLSLLLAYFVF